MPAGAIIHYPSPLGEIVLTADELGLTGLWFAEQSRPAAGPGPALREEETPALAAARRWLEIYFAGVCPDFTPPLHPAGSEFQQVVWGLLPEIPYGGTDSYGALAARAARALGRPVMSAQAVGGAVGRNPISIIVPCHRVVGASGSLTGYAGGLGRKLALLKLEGADTRRLFMPRTGSK